jgi:cytochrome c oxidase subunit 2
VYHSRMLFNVNVTTQAAFDKHLEALQQEGNVGMNAPGPYNAEVKGLEHSNGEFE